MTLKTLAICLLLASGLIACGEQPTESPASAPPPPAQTHSTPTPPPKPTTTPPQQPKVYADEVKYLMLPDYIRYDLTQIIPYTKSDQDRIFDLLVEMAKGRINTLKKCSHNSYYQTAYGFYLQSIKNYTEAKKYYEMASQKGNAYAENRLGELYLLGLGVERDIEQAKYWFERSAKTGYYFAESALGVIYLKVDHNTLLAHNGDMGGLWFSSVFITRSLRNRAELSADEQKLAGYWLARASAQGDGASSSLIKRFRLSPEPLNMPNNAMDIHIKTPSCHQDETRPLIIIKENLPDRYKSEKGKNQGHFRLFSNWVFLGDQVVTRTRNPNPPTQSQKYQEFIKMSETQILPETTPNQ